MVSSGPVGHFAIGLHFSIAHDFLADLRSRFRADYPMSNSQLQKDDPPKQSRTQRHPSCAHSAARSAILRHLVMASGYLSNMSQLQNSTLFQ
jgi:hypothetical protein